MENNYITGAASFMNVKIFTTFCLALMLYVLVGCDSSETPSDSSTNDSDSDGVADSNDCAPDDNLRWNSLNYNSIDSDSDGYRTNTQGNICTNNILPAGFFSEATSENETDCDDSNINIWRNVPLYSDLDDDGIGSGVSQLTCIGDTPNVHFSLSGYDCNDADNAIWRRVVVYTDLDGDGNGSGAGILNCIGNNADTGYSIQGYDPNDNPLDPNSYSISNFDLPKELLIAIDSDGDDDLP